MSNKQFLLSDPFECDGRWWLPSTPEIPLVGGLKYGPDEISVRLNGTLGSVSTEQAGMAGSDFRRFDCLHGVLDDGQRCTLLRVFVTAYTGSWMVCSASYLVIGYHLELESLDQLRLTSISASSPRLDDFLDRTFFTAQTTRGDDSVDPVDQATVTYTKPETLVFPIPTISARLEIGSTFRLSWGRGTVEALAGSHFTIVPESPQSLEWFNKALWQLCDLLTLLTDEPVYPSWIRITPDGDADDGPLLYTSGGKQGKGAVFPTVFLLFYLAHFGEKFGDILARWFSASDVLLSTVYLFRDAHRSADASFRGRFLILTQALEAFSRATTDSAYMDTADYERVRRALVTAIPDEVGSDHRASLKNRIKYGNEYSLRKRLSDLLNSMRVEMLECVCTSSTEFAGGIVDTRHYFTHLTDELRPKALSGIPLAWACDKMQMLLRLLLLRWLGVDEDLIVARVTRHPRLAQYIYLARKQPECVHLPA